MYYLYYPYVHLLRVSPMLCLRAWLRDSPSLFEFELLDSRRTTDVRWLFEKASVRPRSGVFLAGFGFKQESKFGGKISKKGQILCPLQIFTSFSDSKFNVDFNFSIKHDPSLRFDGYMSIQSQASGRFQSYDPVI